MSKGKKVGLLVLVALVVIVGGLAVIIPLLFDVNRYRAQVAAQIQEETGKPAEIGHLALTIFPKVAIRVDNFSLGNPPGFPAGNFVAAKQINVVVNPSALLHRSVEITSLELKNLTLNMLEDTHGKWNFENPPAKAAAPPAESTGSSGPAFTLGVISKVTVSHGEVSVADLLASGAPAPPSVAVHGATINLREVNLSAFSSAALQQPAAPERVAPSRWRGPIVYAADGKGPMAAEGTLRADALRFGQLGVTKLETKMRLYPKQVFLDDLDLRCYGGKLTGNVSLNFGGANLKYRTDARLKGVNVAQFLEAFPQAKGMLTGTLDAAAKIDGTVVQSADPLAGIAGAGQASIRDGQMPSLQLGSNLRMLAKMVNLGPANGDPSSFSSLSSDFRIADSRLSSNKVALVGNGMEVDGSGNMTMAGDGTLDYQGTASLAAGGSSSPLTNVLGSLTGATFANGKLSFPFTVGGTFAKPKFGLKHGATPTALPTNVQSVQKSVDTLRGLAGMFKKKQQ